MKTIFRLCLLFPLLAGNITWGNVRSDLRVGIYNNPPLTEMGSGGIPRGLAVDVLTEIAGRAGWKLRYVPGTFQQVLNRLKQRNVDILLAVAKTPARNDFASFSKESIVFNWGQLICQRGLRISSLPDLSGRTVAVLRGDIFYTGPEGIMALVRKFGIQCRFLQLDSYPQIAVAVAIQKADAGVVDRFFRFSNKIPPKVSITHVIFSPVAGGIAVPKGEEPILRVFDRELHRMKQGKDSLYSHILSRWLGTPTHPDNFWSIHRAFFVGLILLLALLGLYTFSLLFLVRKKTEQIRRAYRQLQQEVEIHRQTSRELLALSSLVEQAEEGVIIVDEKGRLLLFNPAAGEIFGLDFSKHSGEALGEVLGGNSGFLEAVLESTRNGQHWNGLAELQGEDNGKGLILEVSAFPVRSGNGEILFHGLTFWDVTREQALEARLREKQKLELVGQLAGGIAHDFNNLLTVIGGNAELIQLRSDREQIKKLAETIVRTADRGAVLVNQLLGFSRKQMRMPKPLDMETELSELREVFHRLLPEDIELSIEVEAELPILEADPVQIYQVLSNLVINARDAVRENPGCPPVIRIQIYPVTVDAAKAETLALSPGLYVALAVSDSGPGILPELRDRIFEPFFTTKEVGKGSGLGLATVQGIVRQNGGTIIVSESELGGALFTVYWPVPAESDPVVSPGEGAENAGGTLSPKREEMVVSRGKILVVEDETYLLDFIKDVLTGIGFQVLIAENGEDALALFRESTEIVLVITDVVMPGINGVELGRRIQELRPDTKILFTSGYDRGNLREYGIGRETKVLKKPYSVNELRNAVLKIIKN